MYPTSVATLREGRNDGLGSLPLAAPEGLKPAAFGRPGGGGLDDGLGSRNDDRGSLSLTAPEGLKPAAFRRPGGGGLG